MDVDESGQSDSLVCYTHRVILPRMNADVTVLSQFEAPCVDSDGCGAQRSCCDSSERDVFLFLVVELVGSMFGDRCFNLVSRKRANTDKGELSP